MSQIQGIPTGGLPDASAVEGNLVAFAAGGLVRDSGVSAVNPSFTSVTIGGGDIISQPGGTYSSWDASGGSQHIVITAGRAEGTVQFVGDLVQFNTAQVEFGGALSVGLNTGTGTGGKVFSLDGGTITEDAIHFIALPTADGAQGQRLYVASVNAGTHTTTLAYGSAVEDIRFSFDGLGQPIFAASSATTVIDFACTIVGWTILIDPTSPAGSIQFGVAASNYASFPTTTSIVASAPPLITSAQKGQSSTLTGWTTAIPAGEALVCSVTSASTLTKATLVLQVVRTA